MKRLFDPDDEIISDLVREGDTPTHEQIAVGKMALDDYYNGTKDADMNGAMIHVYRAMTAIEIRSRNALAQSHGPTFKAGSFELIGEE